MSMVLHKNSNGSGSVELDLAAAPPRSDHYDPFFGDFGLRLAYRHLQAGDWGRLEAHLAEDRTLATWFTAIVTSERIGVDRVAVAMWERAMETPLARVIHARVRLRDAISVHRLNFASELARDGRLKMAHEHDAVVQYPGLARSTPDDQRSDVDLALRETLGEIDETLRQITSDYPALPDPWVALLISGRNLGLPLEVIRDRFDRLHQISPFHPEGCHQYLTALTKRWGGSVVATFDLSRWIEQQSPLDSPARMSLPTAHLEQGLLDYGREDLPAYLSKPEVAGELTAGLAQYLEATPEEPGLDELVTLNCYAATMTAQDQTSGELIAELWKRIGNRPTEWPWAIWSQDNVTGVFSYRETTGLRAAKRF